MIRRKGLVITSSCAILFGLIIIIILIFKYLPVTSAITNIIAGSRNVVISEKRLPEYKLDQSNFKNIYYGGMTYQITNEKVSRENIDVPIGKILKDVSINDTFKEEDKNYIRENFLSEEKSNSKDFIVKVGLVYKIKDKNSKKNIAILINSNYYLAKMQ